MVVLYAQISFDLRITSVTFILMCNALFGSISLNFKYAGIHREKPTDDPISAEDKKSYLKQ